MGDYLSEAEEEQIKQALDVFPDVKSAWDTYLEFKRMGIPGGAPANFLKNFLLTRKPYKPN